MGVWRKRRKFFDLSAAHASPMAQEALARIAALYEIEARGWTMAIDARTASRRQEAVLLLKSLHPWLKTMRLTVAHGGGLAKALDYSQKGWAALSRYALDGSLVIEIDQAENTIRPLGCAGR